LEQTYENKCTLCDLDQTLINQKCSMINSYLYFNCASSNQFGKDYLNFSCNFCNNNFLPYDMTDTYVCTPLSSISLDFWIQNCIKYEFNDVSLRYDCWLCKSGYFLTNGECNQ